MHIQIKRDSPPTLEITFLNYLTANYFIRICIFYCYIIIDDYIDSYFISPCVKLVASATWSNELIHVFVKDAVTFTLQFLKKAKHVSLRTFSTYSKQHRDKTVCRRRVIFNHLQCVRTFQAHQAYERKTSKVISLSS